MSTQNYYHGSSVQLQEQCRHNLENQHHHQHFEDQQQPSTSSEYFRNYYNIRNSNRNLTNNNNNSNNNNNNNISDNNSKINNNNNSNKCDMHFPSNNSPYNSSSSSREFLNVDNGDIEGGINSENSHASGIISDEGYMPNYYASDEISISSNEDINVTQNYQKMHGMHHSYYERLFRPPPSSYYSHTYPRPNVESNNSQFIQPPSSVYSTSSGGYGTGGGGIVSQNAAISGFIECTSTMPPPLGPPPWYNQQSNGSDTYNGYLGGGNGSGTVVDFNGDTSNGNIPADQMMSLLQFSNSNGREARNRAEKNRRDKLNGSIQELSTMVPHVAESPRRVDKTAVLRFSAHGLRLHYVFGKTLNKAPAVKPQITDSLMRLLDSFLLTVTCRGQIVLISPSVEQHLGHCQTDLFGQNILHITHSDDHAMLKKQLIPTDLETLFDIQPEDDSGEPRPRTPEEEEEIDRKLREDKRNFTVRLARAGPRSEPTTYEIVKIDGCFRRADSAPRGVKSSTFPSGLQLIRRARGRDDSIPLHTISGNDIVLVAMARVIKPPKICDRLLEANHYEYKTRHLIDGRIIQCDQRISLVAGYMTEEVNGLSAFTFMHQDDVRWVIVALRQMYDCNNAYGESCYRLLSRTGNFIYLRTRGFLEIDKSTNKVHSFVCINTLVTEEEGKRRVQEMKNKFSIIINAKVQPSAIDAPAAENPHQLEKAIIYLLQNLQKSENNEGESSSGDSERSNHDRHDSNSRHTKSPPLLTLIPPKPSTIKSSISKSVDVLNITVAKHLRACRSKSGSHDQQQSSDLSSDEGLTNDSSCCSVQNSCADNDNTQLRPSVVKRNDSVASESRIIRSPQSDVEILSDNYENNDNRIPPLPNADGYFEMSTFSSDIDPTTLFATTTTTTNTFFSSTEDGSENTCSYSHTQVIQRNISNSNKRSHGIDDRDNIEDRNNSVIKRSKISELDLEEFVTSPLMDDITNPNEDLTSVLTTSFEELDRSLNRIENATTELKDQCSSYRVDPSSQHQLEEIIEEHQEQREMLQNIQDEYEAHLHTVTKIESPTTSTSSSTFTNNQTNELKPR